MSENKESLMAISATGVMVVVALMERVLASEKTSTRDELVLALATHYLKMARVSEAWGDMKSYAEDNAGLSDTSINVFRLLDKVGAGAPADLPNTSAGYVKEPSPEFDEGLERELRNILNGEESGE